jgi:hypothetical protein
MMSTGRIHHQWAFDSGELHAHALHHSNFENLRNFMPLGTGSLAIPKFWRQADVQRLENYLILISACLIWRSE